MRYSRVPVCYFPTTVVFVDDSKRFLSNLSFKLDEKLAYLFFEDPQKALYFLNVDKQPNHLINRCLSINTDLEDHSSEQHALNLDISAIYKEVYNKNRFNDVSVVVVDYSMPSMDGLDFVKQIKNPYIKIIMLTGEADQALAVEAFNEGTIDKFILKSSANYEEILNSSIIELQQQFFQELTEGIIKLLAVESSNSLEDPGFRKIFDKILIDKKIIEYYLIDITGSFLLLDINGKASWFIIKTAEDLKMYSEIAEDTEAPKVLREQLKSGDKIAHFFSADDIHEVNGIDWELYLYSAKPLQGKQKYFYALLDKVNGSVLKVEDIVSYEYYLGNDWPPAPIASI